MKLKKNKNLFFKNPIVIDKKKKKKPQALKLGWPRAPRPSEKGSGASTFSFPCHLPLNYLEKKN